LAFDNKSLLNPFWTPHRPGRRILPMSDSEASAFLHRTVPRLRKSVFRLGLSTLGGIDAAGVREALEGPVNYLFWSPRKNKAINAEVRKVVQRDRERLVIATGPVLGYFAGSIRRAAERSLRALGTDYLDVFQVFWAGKMSFLSKGVVGELIKLREEGKVRAIGLSTHDRKRAGRLAEDSVFDMLMIRYNAAHPGAETDIFPHLAQRQPILVDYTATSWRKLLTAPKGWKGSVATAGDCYRFCLSNPHVDVVLQMPKNIEQMRENLRAIEKGPLSEAEMTWMRNLGTAVHG
jgi:aryl-alcohol dehydrogenase-like predicted oxidoreductase